MPRIRTLELTGSPYEMGWQHGAAHAEAIHHFSDERVRLSGAPKWTGCSLDSARVLALAEACLPAHHAYSPALMAELQGMADASGESLPRLIVNNGFTDFIDTVYALGEREQQPEYEAHNCTAFLVGTAAAEQGQAMYGQTWDMHASATPYVLLLHGRPDDGPAFLTLSVAGCVGMMGMNEAGICIGVNNLMGGDGQIGVTWPFVIRRALAQTTLAAAPGLRNGCAPRRRAQLPAARSRRARFQYRGDVHAPRNYAPEWQRARAYQPLPVAIYCHLRARAAVARQLGGAAARRGRMAHPAPATDGGHHARNAHGPHAGRRNLPAPATAAGCRELRRGHHAPGGRRILGLLGAHRPMANTSAS